MWRIGFSLLWLVSGLLSSAAAVEVAPRISDREIIESLAELKAGQKALQQQIEDLKHSTQQQINDLKQSTQQQINDLKQSTQQQINDLKQSTQQQINDLRQDMNQRFNDVMTLLHILIGVLAGVLGGIIAWLTVIWRRLVQMEERQKTFELQEEQIRFLREGYGRLEGAVLQLLERSAVSR
jgi:gas vesicle protein